MKLNKIYYFVLLLAVSFFFVACGSEKKTYTPSIEIYNNSYNLVVGEALDLEANLKSATGTHKEDLKSSVSIQHSIPLENGKVTESGDYTVKYVLVIGEEEYNTSCVVIVSDFDEDAYHPLVTRKEFTKDGFVIRILNTGLTKDDAKILNVEIDIDNYDKAALSSLNIDAEGNLDAVIDLKEKWDNAQHSYSISFVYRGHEICTVEKNMFYNPDLALKSLSLQYDLGTKIDEKLKENILGALFTDKSDATSAVVISHSIPVDANGAANTVGSYAVTYQLKEGTFIKKYDVTVDVIDMSATKPLPNIPSVAINAKGLEGTYFVTFNYVTVNNSLVNATSLAIEEVANNVEYKYVIYNSETNDVIGEMNKGVGNSSVAFLKCSDAQVLVEKYMTETGLTSVSLYVTVQLVRKAGCSIAFRNGEATTSTNVVTIGSTPSTTVDSYAIPEPFGLVVYGTVNTFNVNFAYPYLCDSITEGLNMSLGELYNQFVFEYVIYDTKNRNTIKVIQRAFQKNNNILIYADDVRDDIDKYMEDNDLDKLTFGITLQVKKANTFNLKVKVTDGAVVEFPAGTQLTIDLSNVVNANCLIYNELLGVASESEIMVGQACIWHDVDKATTSLTATLNPETKDITFVGYQDISGSWWQNQFFATCNPVFQGGTYKQELVFISNVEGSITINNSAYDIHVGENVIKVVFDLDAGQSAHLSIQFGNTKTGKAFESFVITMKGLTQETKLELYNGTLNAKIGDNVEEILRANIQTAIDDYGKKANNLVSLDYDFSVENGLFSEEGIFGVAYILNCDFGTKTLIITINITE